MAEQNGQSMLALLFHLVDELPPEKGAALGRELARLYSTYLEKLARKTPAKELCASKEVE